MASNARVVSAAFALSGFTVALISGLSAGNTSSQVLFRALVALFACQFVGMIIGSMLDRVIEEHEASYRKAHPIPVVPSVGAVRDSDGVMVVGEAVDEQGTTRAAS
jgi:hypothetical protein